MSEKRVLFCWSGGGLPGLDIHAGLWLALSEADIVPTRNVGTSAGALIAALNSSGRSASYATALLTSLEDSDVRAFRFLWQLRFCWINSILKTEPIEALIKAQLPLAFSSLEKPLSIFATDDLSGKTVQWDEGNLRSAVLASMSISGIFPSAWRGNNGPYSDGGTTENLPLPFDFNSYDEVYMMVAARPLTYKRRRSGVFSRVLRNIDLLIEDQTREQIKFARENHPAVTVLWPRLEAPNGTLHFDHDLIPRAYEQARAQLEAR